jgi:quinolinate synthase
MDIDPTYARVSHVIPPFEWAILQEDVAAIQALKRERRAVILAHNYQTPDIFHGVADIVGDSLALAREAARADADVILVAGVHFMAETAKLMNPDKTVLIPDALAGCSLAESITPEDIARLRVAHPGVPIVAYVNTSAAVKAASDICCTSGNAKKIVESLGVPEVIMLPDEYLAQNIARETGVKIITWAGHCEVHERFTAEEILSLRGSGTPEHLIAEGNWHPSASAMATANVRAGERGFQIHCATCHGANGQTRWEAGFKRLPPDLAVGPYFHLPPSADDAQRRDRIARIIKFGIPGTDMPGHEYLSDDEIASISLWLSQSIGQLDTKQ